MIHQPHRANLRGRDFRRKNLAGEDFTNADIRGVKFTNATLIGVNFRNAKAGLPTSWKMGMVILSVLLSLLAGLISGYSGALIGDLLNNIVDGSYLLGSISLITIGIFLIVIFWRGLGVTLATLAEITAACLIASIAFSPNDKAGVNLAISTTFFVVGLAGIVSGVGNMAVAIALAKVIAMPAATTSTGLIGFIGIVIGVLLGFFLDESNDYFPSGLITLSGLIGLLAITSGVYVGRQAINGNIKYKLIRSLPVGIVAYGGTSFRGANLTDADFTQATLTSVDFREANLTRTCWFNAKNLEQARVEGTYLEQANVRQLAITKDGRGQEFNNINLRYLNLKNANLQDAEFISTDLSEANLKNANLFGAKLAETQLYQANLTAACLTGAYIENWGISTDTQLEGIQCDFVYMRLPTQDDPDPWRKPDNRQEKFKKGDFADFVAPIIKTLDLYKTQNSDPRQVGGKFKSLDLLHYEGIDPTAAAIAIIQLAEHNPDADLQIVALEGRGEEKIRLQARVAGDANPSDLSREYFEKYIEFQSLSYSSIQELIISNKAKEEQLSYYKNLFTNAINQPKVYVETINSRGSLTMSESKGNISIGNAQGNISGLAATGENASMTGMAMGNISGTVTNAINQLPDFSEAEPSGIKRLLQELQAAIEADSNLSGDDKTEALEQLEIIAVASQKPEDATTQRKVKKAVTFLKGIIADLPTNAELVTTCNRLLPLIADRVGNKESQSNPAPANSIKIMFLASDPTDAARLRLGQELRDIQKKLQLAKQRERFILQQQMSVRPGDISQTLLEFEPMIVHFSGHGTSNGELCFENELGKIQPVKPEALAALFALVSQQVKCVVLNACHSETQAKSIAEHIQFVIGMNQAIGDKAAIAFAVGFYTAIGASRPIPEAYQFGCTQIQLEGIPENLTPILHQKK
ncbi:pentapeptide repeat-containing protein [Calothrix rhizosoleniae]|uniref:pentapeptide repeat-containing protein n=1 Tax=Calothrix rhizosoleniae TaxID=888997 RepID=UPI001F410016|nr:pentapeptide repeat-containing protein [Calothrix rhizosoleniae]